MADSAKTIANLVSVSQLASNDLFVVEANTSGNSFTGKAKTNTVFYNIPCNVSVNNSFSVTANVFVTLANSTPANSSANAISRSIWFDNTYIYVAISNNDIRRVAHSSF